jgi:Kef-type K+ transport system membrane component KefB
VEWWEKWMKSLRQTVLTLDYRWQALSHTSRHITTLPPRSLRLFGSTEPAPTGQALFALILLQLVVILTAARLCGWLARLLRQPVVVGEILGGILLGPSLFQPLFPELSATLFHPATKPAFQAMKELGLMLLLFLVGMEFDFGHLRHLGRAVTMISVVGIILPFGLGLAVAPLIHSQLELTVPLWSLALFLATALAITALPVLGRIMMELGITKTRLGTVAISAAAVNDAVAWILLAGIIAAIQSQFDPWLMVQMIGLTVLFLGVMLRIVRPLVRRLLDWYLHDDRQHLDPWGLAGLLVMLFLSGYTTLKIGIFPEFGAFVLGATLSGHHRLHHAMGESFRNFIIAFFLPIFFTYTGLNTNLGSLNSWHQVSLTVLLIVVAIFGKFVGCAVVAKWNGFRWREASIIGAMMNTRALVGLIVINVGYEQGILNPALFTMLVLMAIITTIMTTPFIGLWYKGTELEPAIEQSRFYRK